MIKSQRYLEALLKVKETLWYVGGGELTQNIEKMGGAGAAEFILNFHNYQY